MGITDENDGAAISTDSLEHPTTLLERFSSPLNYKRMVDPFLLQLLWQKLYQIPILFTPD